MIYPGEGKKGQPKAGDYVLAAEQTRAEAAASPHRSTTSLKNPPKPKKLRAIYEQRFRPN
jgi:hypothetical protein